MSVTFCQSSHGPTLDESVVEIVIVSVAKSKVNMSLAKTVQVSQSYIA